MELNQRQQQILAAIIEQYAEVAAPVGSVMLAKAFKVSSATIRAEMVRPEEQGFINQPHTSAGRVPTDKGYRYYVNQIQDKFNSNESELEVNDRSSQIIDRRIRQAGEPEQAIRSAVESLSQMTQNLGLATIGSNLYMSGLGRLFNQPEFLDGDPRKVANLLDNLEPWLREAAPNKPLNVYIGHENPIGKTSKCTLVISRFRSPYSDSSYVGVLDPTRQSYREVMALVTHAGQALEAQL